jgi:AcrR family transcriptional regulator
MTQDKKHRIMQAVEWLFRTRRGDAVTLDEVARKADVGKGTIYLYFSDKDDLIFQTAVAGFEEMCQLLRRDAAGDGTFRERLLRACENLSAFFRARRPLFRIILWEGERASGGDGTGLRQRWRRRRKTLTEAMAAIIAQGMESREVRPDISADILAEYLLGMLRTRSWELEDRPQSQRNHAAVVDLFLNGVGLPARRH